MWRRKETREEGRNRQKGRKTVTRQVNDRLVHQTLTLAWWMPPGSGDGGVGHVVFTWRESTENRCVAQIASSLSGALDVTHPPYLPSTLLSLLAASIENEKGQMSL